MFGCVVAMCCFKILMNALATLTTVAVVVCVLTQMARFNVLAEMGTLVMGVIAPVRSSGSAAVMCILSLGKG